MNPDATRNSCDAPEEVSVPLDSAAIAAGAAASGMRMQVRCAILQLTLLYTCARHVMSEVIQLRLSLPDVCVAFRLTGVWA